jgi:CheY-like chemotaxis protein
MSMDADMKQSDEGHSQQQTRHLDKAYQQAVQMPVRATGPLDRVLPWVLEFRVVGTASTIQMRVSEYMTIGRSDPERGIEPDINLAPHGGQVLGVSRQHAIILAKDERITIRDVGSSNGTRLNGYVLVPHQDYRLRHGDELTVGQLHLQVLFAVVPLFAPDGSVPTDTIIPRLGSGQHIMIVEDDADVASVFGMILEQAGFRVSIMNNAMMAMNAMNQALPDAVVLDLLLPDIDGLELTRYVRKVEEDSGRHTPVVVVSGATGGFQMSQAMKAGADVFLGKPVGVDELVKAFVSIMPQIA